MNMKASCMMPSSTHVEGRDTCIGCHDPHTLKVKVEECAACHGDGVLAEGGLQNIREPQASAWDYDGDGNKEEGMYHEIEGLQEALLAQIQTYAKDKAGAEIKYDAATYPYFMGADGKAYPNWTPACSRPPTTTRFPSRIPVRLRMATSISFNCSTIRSRISVVM